MPACIGSYWRDQTGFHRDHSPAPILPHRESESECSFFWIIFSFFSHSSFRTSELGIMRIFRFVIAASYQMGHFYAAMSNQSLNYLTPGTGLIFNKGSARHRWQSAVFRLGSFFDPWQVLSFGDKKYLRSLFQFLFRRGPEIAYIVDVSFPRGGKWEILGAVQKGQNFTLGNRPDGAVMDEGKEVGRSFRENAKITSSCLRQTESFRLQPGWKHWKPPPMPKWQNSVQSLLFVCWETICNNRKQHF